MIKVDNFFGCWKLETGGLVIGWVNLVSYCIFLVINVIGIVGIIITSCDDLTKQWKGTEEFTKSCTTIRAFLIGGLILLSAFALAFAFISYLCIKGTQTRNHRKIQPLMILMAIIAVLAFLSILSMNLWETVVGWIYGAPYAYSFVILHSLYTTFREEREGAATESNLQNLKA